MTTEEFQKIVLQKFDLLESEISATKSQIQELKSQISNSNSQITEHTDMLKAILHNQEFVNAKIEGLTLTTAKIESVQQLQQEVNVLGRKIYAVSK